MSLGAQHWVNMARATEDKGRAKVYAMWAAAARDRHATNPFKPESEAELHEQWAWFVALKAPPQVVRSQPRRAIAVERGPVKPPAPAPRVSTSSAAYAEIMGADVEERV